MTQEHVTDLLGPYLDETLDRATRHQVDRHLEACAQCRTILDGVPAVRLPGLDSVQVDERVMRRLVRRSILRIAATTVVLTAVAGLAWALVASLVVQPLVVDRSGRAAAATLATHDLAVLINPGAAVDETAHESGFLDRTSSAHVVLPVGTKVVDAGRFETHIGAISGPTVTNFLDGVAGRGAATGAGPQLAALGDGTVATVELVFDTPVPIDEAEDLASSGLDVRVVWAGFAVDDLPATGAGFQAGGAVGYGTCDVRQTDPDFLSALSAGSSRSPFGMPPSVDRALGSTRDALDNLAAHPELTGLLAGASTHGQVLSARAFIVERPAVRVLVVTGPSSELRGFLDATQPAWSTVLDVDFLNWYEPVCGR